MRIISTLKIRIKEYLEEFSGNISEMLRRWYFYHVIAVQGQCRRVLTNLLTFHLEANFYDISNIGDVAFAVGCFGAVLHGIFASSCIQCGLLVVNVELLVADAGGCENIVLVWRLESIGTEQFDFTSCWKFKITAARYCAHEIRQIRAEIQWLWLRQILVDTHSTGFAKYD